MFIKVASFGFSVYRKVLWLLVFSFTGQVSILCIFNKYIIRSGGG